MKPRHLEMHAFGPYAGVEALDFDELPPGALFLVHGPTGSGKTTTLYACVQEIDRRRRHVTPACKSIALGSPAVSSSFDAGRARR